MIGGMRNLDLWRQGTLRGGDSFSLLAHILGWDFRHVLCELACVVGIEVEPAAGAIAQPVAPHAK